MHGKALWQSCSPLNDISRYVVGSGEFDDAAGDWVCRCDVGVGSIGILRVEVKDVGVDGESEVALKVAQPENVEAVAEVVDASAATGGEVTDDLRTTYRDMSSGEKCGKRGFVVDLRTDMKLFSKSFKKIRTRYDYKDRRGVQSCAIT